MGWLLGYLLLCNECSGIPDGIPLGGYPRSLSEYALPIRPDDDGDGGNVGLLSEEGILS